MGLLTIIKKQKLKDKEIRILVLGLDSSGKTTIVKKLLNEDVTTVSPTTGFQINTFEREGITLNIWDVGGQTSLRPFWYNYFERTDCIIWVIDCNSVERLSENFEEFRKILKEDRLVGCSLLIFLNKIDLLNTENEKGIRVVDKSKVSRIQQLIIEELKLSQITNHEWKVVPCSAYTGQNLNEGIDWVIKEVKQRLYII